MGYHFDVSYKMYQYVGQNEEMVFYIQDSKYPYQELVLFLPEEGMTFEEHPYILYKYSVHKSS